MAAEPITGLSTMENDIRMLSSEKQIIENESDKLFKMSVADMEKEREGLSIELKDTIDKCTILSSELDKAMLSENEVQTLLEENQKLKKDNLTLLAERDDLKARLHNLDMECSKLRETITYTKAEKESLITEKQSVESKVQQLEMDIDSLTSEKEKVVHNLKMILNTAESKLEEKDKEILNLQETIKDLEATKIDLHNEVVVHQEENTIALAQLKQVEASLKNVGNQLEKQIEKNSDLTNDVDRLDKQLVEVRRSLHAKIVELHEEKDATLLELHASQTFVKNLETVVEQQNENILSLQAANDELQKTIYTLSEDSEQAKVKLQEELARWNKQLVEVRRSLQGKIAALHQEKDATLLELQASQASEKHFENVVQQQIEKLSSLQQENDELQKTIYTLTQESNQAKAKLWEEVSRLEKHLMEVRRSFHAKLATIHEEKDEALLELQTTQASVRNFEIVVEHQKEKISSQQQSNDELQKTIDALNQESDQAKAKLQKEVSSLENKLVELRKSLHAKIATLHQEKDASLLQLQASTSSLRNFETLIEEQNEKISTLHQANDELHKTIYTLTQESDQAKAKLQDEVSRWEKQLVEVRRSLYAKIATLNEEKDATLLQLQESQDSLRSYKTTVQEQNDKISSLQQDNDELQKIIFTMTEESEQGKIKLQELNDVSNKNIARLEKQLVESRKSLHAKIAALQQEKDATLLQLRESQASLRNFESVGEEQNEKLSSLHRANDELQKIICTLKEESEQGKAKLQEELKEMGNNNIAILEKKLMEVKRSLHAKLAAIHEEKDEALLELQASQASVRNFESVVEQQKEKISSLELANDELQKTIYALNQELDQAKAKFQKEVSSFEKKLMDSRKSLHAKIAALHQERDSSLLRLQESTSSLRNFETLVEQQSEKISSLSQANDKMQRTINTLTQESDQAKAKLQNEVSRWEKQLMEVRRSLHAKIATLNEDKDATLLQLQESQASLEKYKSMVEEQNDRISSLQQDNDGLQKIIYTMTEESEQGKIKLKESSDVSNKNINRLEKQLVESRKSLHAKIAALQQEKDATLLQLREFQASLRNVESVVEEQNEKLSSLQRANDELQKIICTLKEESEQGKAKLQEELKDMENNNIAILEKQLMEVKRSLHAKLAATHEEKDEALLELQASQASVRNFKSVVEQQKEKISSLQQANDEFQKMICALNQELDQAKAKLQKEVSSFEKKLVDSKKSHHAKIAALHQERDASLLQLQESTSSLRNFETLVEQQSEKISSLQQANDELQRTIYTLTQESDQAKAKLQDEVSRWEKQLVEVRKSLHAKISALVEEKFAALLDLQSSRASIRRFESVVEEKNEKIASLQHANDELEKSIYSLIKESEHDKAKLQNEVTRLTNNVSSMEKQLVEVRRSLQAKIVALHQEKDETLLDLHASQSSVRNFENVVEEQRDKISSLQQAYDELQKIICTSIEESEQGMDKLHNQVKDMTNNNIFRMEKQLVEVRRCLHAKIVALHEQKDATLLELHTSQASARNFESIVEEQNEKILFLQQENDELKKTICALTKESEQGKAKLQEEVKAMTNNVAMLEKQLVEVRKSLHAKMAVLHEEKDAVLLELHASQTSVRNIESVVVEQNENISSLQKGNDELQKTICTLIEQSKQANAKLQEEVKTTQEEKDIVVTRFKQSLSYIKNLENEVARLVKELSIQVENNSKLDKHLEEATLKVDTLSERLEKSQAEMASYIDDMSLKTKELEDTINVLSSQKTKVAEDMKMLVQGCSGNMAMMKEFEDRVKQRIANDVTRFHPLHQSLREVLTSYQKIQYAYDELSTRASRLEVLKENQMEHVDKIHQLKEEKLNTFMENTKLHKRVQDLEIQLQHLKQKLMEYKWKEDRFAATLETSQEEMKNLEQLVSLQEETLQEIKEHAESGVFRMVGQLDKLESSLSQGFPRFVYRSSASSEELKVLRNKLHVHLDEQKELLKKKDNLAIRWRNKENMLSERVRNVAEARILEKKVEEKETGEERTDTPISSKRWPILRRRKWRRNSYSC